MADKNIYEKYAKEYEENTKDFLLNYLVEDANLFLQNIEDENKSIIDLGSGPGLHSIYFKEKGFNPVCMDNSLEMVESCQEKNLEAHVMDMRRMHLLSNHYVGGVWAYLSLFRCIEKEKVPKILRQVKRILKKDGIFYTGAREGNLEEFREDSRYLGVKRFDVFYTEKEMTKILSEDFKIIHSSKTRIDKKTYLNYLCKVRPT